MVSISYHDTVNVLQGTIKQDAFSPFDRAEWFGLLENAGARPLVALAHDGDDYAALILTERNDRLESLVNWYSFSWAPHFGDRPDLLAALAADLRSKSHRITMWPIRGEGSNLETLHTAFRTAGWSVQSETCDHNHVLEVDGRSFAKYWASRSGQMRTTLKRKAKKVVVEILSHFDANAWAAYESIYQSSWKPEEGDPALLRAFAEQEGAAGRIRLALARVEGKPVAAQFWTVERGTAYIHKLAHLEEHKALSAGTTLSAALFEQVIDSDGVSLIDFGTGNDPYKSDWMELDRPRYRLDCLDPKQPKAWPALAKRQIVRLARDAPQS